MEDFYAKYRLQLLPMIHQTLCSKHNTTEWSAIYTPHETHLRTELLKVMKADLIKRKRDELGGTSADEQLTKDNLERWLAEGETFNSIAYKYTGTPPDKIARIAKAHGLTSKGKEAYTNAQLPTDADLTVYVTNNTTNTILNAVATAVVAKWEGELKD
jgi:hypothetical protein